MHFLAQKKHFFPCVFSVAALFFSNEQLKFDTLQVRQPEETKIPTQRQCQHPQCAEASVKVGFDGFLGKKTVFYF